MFWAFSYQFDVPGKLLMAGTQELSRSDAFTRSSLNPKNQKTALDLPMHKKNSVVPYLELTVHLMKLKLFSDLRWNPDLI